MNNSSFVTLFKLGYFICDVPENIMDFTRKETSRMITSNFEKRLSFKQGLAGAIEHEYRFSAPTGALNRFFEKIIPEYWNNLDIVDEKDHPAKKVYHIPPSTNGYTHVWANFQKKYEHNPLHMHSGDLSFVYWVKVPYDLEEEKNLPHTMTDKQHNPTHSTFAFYYPLSVPRAPSLVSHHINVDKTYEGKMIIFPSWLHHTVTPFYTSDEYRVSIAGNLFQKN